MTILTTEIQEQLDKALQLEDLHAFFQERSEQEFKQCDGQQCPIHDVLSSRFPDYWFIVYPHTIGVGVTENRLLLAEWFKTPDHILILVNLIDEEASDRTEVIEVDGENHFQAYLSGWHVAAIIDEMIANGRKGLHDDFFNQRSV